MLVEHAIPVADPKTGAQHTRLDIGREWMTRALSRAMRRHEQDHYLPPLHVDHKGAVPKTQLAGRYKLRSVKRGRYEGKPRWMLYCDLCHVPPEIYAEIRAGRLPYLSCEIHDTRSSEIDSIALMCDTVPFFRLPMLTVGAEKPYGRTRLIKQKPAIAYSSIRANGAAILMDTRGHEMDHEAMGRAFASFMKSYMGEEEELIEAPPMEAPVDEMPEELMDEEEVIEAPSLDDPAPVEQMPEEMMDEEFPEEEDAEVEYCSVKNCDKRAQMQASRDGAVHAQYSALQRQVARQEAELAALRRERHTEQLVSRAVKDLEGYGATEATIRRYAAQGKAVLKTYMDTLRKHSTPPPSMWDGEQAAHSSDPDTRLILSDIPAERQQEALQLIAEHKQMSGNGMKLSDPSTYVKRCLGIETPSQTNGHRRF